MPGEITKMEVEVGGRPHIGTVVAVSVMADLAIVWFQGGGATPWARLADAAPQKGAAVSQAGYPQLGPLRGQTGKAIGYAVPSVHPLWPQNQDLVLDFSAIGGDSGSGIFTGDRLCGVLWGGPTDKRIRECRATALPEIVQFLEGCKLPLPWKPRPPPGQPLPPPGPGPVPQPQPKPDPGAGLGDKLERLRDRLESAERRLDNLGRGVEQGAGLLERVKDRMGQAEGKLDAGLSLLGKVKGRVDQAEGGLDRIGKTLDGGLGLLDRLHGRVSDQEKIVEKKLPVVDGLIGLAPWLIVGSATGGAFPLLLGGLKILRLLRGARKVRRALRAREVPVAEPGSVEPQIIYRDVPAPVPPPVVHEKSVYVPIEKPNEELAALKRAIDEMVVYYPGLRPTMEALKKWGQQCQDPRKAKE